MRFDLEFFVSCFPKLILKIPYTLYLGLIAFVIAFALGFILYIILSFNTVYYTIIHFLFRDATIF